MRASRLNTYASVCEDVRNIMLTRATLMNTVQPEDIGQGEGRMGKDKEGDKGKRKKFKQPAGSPRGTANENLDKDVQYLYCGKKGH